MGNSLPQPRNEHGQYISLEKFVMSIMDERFAALRKDIDRREKALEIQAKEYERRLELLNHAHDRAQAALNTFVRIDKWEDKIEAEEEALKLALERQDERITSLNMGIHQRLEEYITKSEARQAEIDQAITLQEGAAMEAQRAAEEQGRKSDEQARELARKTNRNMAILGFVVAIVIAISNWLGA